jgi:ABC-type uncharacterized transport system ATPase subunit
MIDPELNIDITINNIPAEKFKKEMEDLMEILKTIEGIIQRNKLLSWAFLKKEEKK